jgi:hypothetical protein
MSRSEEDRLGSSRGDVRGLPVEVHDERDCCAERGYVRRRFGCLGRQMPAECARGGDATEQAQHVPRHCGQARAARKLALDIGDQGIGRPPDSYPEHEREARTRGTPALGSGRIFSVSRSMPCRSRHTRR